MNVVIKKMKRVVTRATTASKGELEKVYLRGWTYLAGPPLRMTGLVYPDGKTFNVLVEHIPGSAVVELELKGRNSGLVTTRMDVVTQGPGWTQYFGAIPSGTTAFELRARRKSKLIPMVDATRSAQGQGHIRSQVSWKTGAHWISEFRPRGIRFGLLSDEEPVSVSKISLGLGRLTIHLSFSADLTGPPGKVVLRNRKTGETLAMPVDDHTEDRCIIDGATVLERVGSNSVGRTVWDLEVDGRRLRLGTSDISNPRAVYQFGWVKAFSRGSHARIRPYWTLDGFLSLEMKISVSASLPSSK